MRLFSIKFLRNYICKPQQKNIFLATKKPKIALDSILDFQKKSYDEFLQDDIKKLFKEFFPIDDANDRFTVEYIDHELEAPKISCDVARQRKVDYSGQLKVYLSLTNKITGTKQKEEILFADIPMMTPQNSFIINGIERVVVSQLVRSSGVRFFKEQKTKGQISYGCEVRPIKGKGVWVGFETDSHGNIFVRINQGTKKVPVTTFIRLFGPQTKEEVKRLFADDAAALARIEKTFAIDDQHVMDEVYVKMYSVMRSGEVTNPDKAKEVVLSKFADDFFDLSEIGRANLNRRMSVETKKGASVNIHLDDIVYIIKEMIRLSADPYAVEDDIDALSVRRVRPVGELFREHIRIGFLRMRKLTKDRMITMDPLLLKNPTSIINLRIFKTTIQSFFNTNQLAQQLKQQNILDELEHFRTLSVMGVGGLMRDHAGVGVRDVHPSHYGRICPIHTPEGLNAGLVLHLAAFARLNQHGLIETPYVKVERGVVTSSIEYFTADEEEKFRIAPASTEVGENGKIKGSLVPARFHQDYVEIAPDEVEYMDVSTGQIFSVATSLVPFAGHNDGVRSLYGSTMQRQAVPCVRPEFPLVATGYEEILARASSRMCIAEESGEVTYVDASKVTLSTSNGKKEYLLTSYVVTNGGAFSSHQRPIVSVGQKIKKGDVLADVLSTAQGQLALGKNIRVAFACYDGLNYEDSIIVSRRLNENDTFTSIEVEEFICDIRETKIGPEVMTSDIPNVSEFRLRNLNPEGVVQVGADVRAGDILVGKVTPRGESLLTPEERLLQSIFGDKAKDVKDTSLTLPSGKKGRVMSVEIRTREDGYLLETGVLKQVCVTVAELRSVQEGDKLANRHGNKGVISKVLPVEDMPFTEDGEPVDIVLSPLGVPSRQNLGQILEIHLGLAAHTLDYQAIVPPLTSVSEPELRDEIEKAGFDPSGRIKLWNGKTGEQLDAHVTVGYMYMMKLHHMVEDKIQARSTGPYSLVSQQPLGGRSRRGGQRLGEMEVWALLGHGAAYTLREMLTTKSDDIQGRSTAYNAIIKNHPITQTGTPASFNVLMYYLRGLGLNINLKDSELDEGAFIIKNKKY